MRDLYRDTPQEQPFSFYLEWHLHFGFVFATPDYFVMGRCVNRADFDPDAPLLVQYDKEQSDAWYIHAFSGKMPKLWEIMPWPLPYIGWERIREGKRELQFYDTATLMRLCPPQHEIAPT